MIVEVTREAMDEMQAHARATFPNECCGIVVDRGAGLEVVRVTNIQDRLHAQDPVRYPRTATTAFALGEEAGPILLEESRGNLRIHAIYHSHPQHDAYFSDEDRKRANDDWGDPLHPEAGHIVISVYDAEVRDVAAFRWDPDGADYVAADIRFPG